jgi:hypothetical protein
VCDADWAVIAGAFRREGTGWCWALPHVPDHPELWLAAALSFWSERTPKRVPTSRPWTVRDGWITKAQIELRNKLAAIREEREAVLGEFVEREATLEAGVLIARVAAEAGPLRLLTSQGDELVEAVIAALEAFGYIVTDVDDETPPGQAKVEDLRVLDPDQPHRTNITEIKGYAEGAKARDLIVLERYGSLFAQRTGELPDSLWYVVNQFRELDPDRRQEVLTGADEQIEAFASDGGLVIDTRVLFQLHRSLETGERTSAEIRELISTATGRLTL